MSSSQADLTDRTRHEHPRLRIYLLGSPQVKWDDEVLDVPRRQVRALLYYLATHLQRAPCEYLRFLFWPDRSDTTARRYLSHLLTHLRRALPDPSPLIASGDHVKLDPHLAWSDVTTFRRLVTSNQPDNNVERLERAVELYRGSFLHGFSLDNREDWGEQEGYFLEHLYLKALSYLIDAYTANHSYEEAILYAQRYLQVDDLAEQVHLRLIRLYTLAGKRGMAIEQFQRCVKVIGDDLGVSPIPEIQASYEEALQKGTAKPLTTGSTALPVSPDAPQETTIVGNRQTLDKLVQAFREVRDGRGQMVTISGEAGIGKSQVMREFAQRVSGEAKILTATCQAHAQSVPYYALMQALHGGGEPDALRQGVHPSLPAKGAREAPDRGNLEPDSPQWAYPASNPGYLAATDLSDRLILELTSGPRPVLLAFDDVHRADNATLDWLVHLGLQLDGKRILVLASYCCTAIGPLADFRHRLIEGGGLGYEIQMAGIDTEEVLQLVRQATGRFGDDHALAERLVNLTAGNPSLVLELLKSFTQSGSMPQKLGHVDPVPLPTGVHALVLTRVGRLSSVARRVIEACSFLEPPFDFHQVCLSAGCSEIETVDALDELVGRHLLADEYPLYRFCHELVPRVIQENMSPLRREILSRRAASCTSL
jgi:DNA-binding SARP family transcriptional activator